jgi:hypothetical protein
MKKPILLFFQEVKWDDVKKHLIDSNIAKTGGGARDVRIRRAKEFRPILARMFPNKGSKEGVLQGPIYWYDEAGTVQKSEIEFWRPTPSRPNEARIGKSYKIGSWALAPEVFKESIQRGKKWFYLLVMDADRVIWARLLNEDNLPKEAPVVRDYIQARIQATKPRNHVMGTMDFETRKVYP